MIRIMLIDDERDMLVSLQKILSRNNRYKTEMYQEGSKALDMLDEKSFDGVLCDLKMPDISGMEILKKVRRVQPDAFFIMITGYGTIESSVEAMRLGADNFIEKPFTAEKLLETIEKAVKVRGLEPEVNESSDLPLEKQFSDILFKSNKIRDLLEMIRRVSTGDANILITGESGTGKELVARNIHRLSRRAEYSFIPVNCAALPENLFESELFGYEKGAFTGAGRTKPGLVEFADKGTFFFDEIGDMSLNLQVKLLRMLEERKIRRVGGQREIAVDIRVISATNRNLEHMIEEGRFREDLSYRLNTIQIHIPPVRERPEDILYLAEHTLAELREKEGKNVYTIADDARDALTNYNWPGNVREIQNMVTRAFYLCQHNEIRLEDLPPTLQKSADMIPDKLIQMEYKEAKEQVLQNFEKRYLSYYLKKHKGNISKAADECGIDRRTIHRLINKYNIIYGKD